MSRIDQDLVSHDAVSIAVAATTTYGKDIPLKSIPDNVGNFNLVAHFSTVPAGAGNVTVNLYGGAAANPTAVTQQIFTGTLAELAAALRNGELNVGITPGALKAFNRVGIINSGTLTDGVVTSFITPKFA